MNVEGLFFDWSTMYGIVLKLFDTRINKYIYDVFTYVNPDTAMYRYEVLKHQYQANDYPWLKLKDIKLYTMNEFRRNSWGVYTNEV